jgi:hypothetical protein
MAQQELLSNGSTSPIGEWQCEELYLSNTNDPNLELIIDPRIAQKPKLMVSFFQKLGDQIKLYFAILSDVFLISDVGVVAAAAGTDTLMWPPPRTGNTRENVLLVDV